MGRTLVVQAFLLATVCTGFSASFVPQARASEILILPTSGDPVDELISWLDQLCFVVHCEGDRTSEGGSAIAADLVAIRFVLSYETYGVRDDLSLNERDYAYLVSLRATKFLTDNPGRIEPEVEKSLFEALRAIRSDLSK